MTSGEAIENAVRLLHAVEQETDRALMERWNALADSWLEVAALLNERENA